MTKTKVQTLTQAKTQTNTNNKTKNETTNKLLNKSDFIDHIAKEHNITKAEAERAINIYTASTTSALAKGNDIQLIGFGKFYTSKVAAKEGRNPKTGAPLKISAYTSVKFSAGEKLKGACN